MLKYKHSLITYTKNSKEKDIITFLQISKDINNIIHIFLRLKNKHLYIDIQPQIKEFKDNIYNNYLMCAVEDLDNNLIATFDIDIPIKIYSQYIGMSNFNFEKNKDEYHIFIHQNEFDFKNKEILI